MRKRTKNSKVELESLRLPELQARYREVVGETTMSPNRKFLMRRIEETLATQASGTSAPEPTTEVAPTETVPEQPTAETEVTEGAQEIEPTTTEPTTEPEVNETTVPEGEPTEESTPAMPPADAALQGEAAQAAHSTEGAPQGEPPAEEKKPRGRFAAMLIADLQALYAEKVGRPSGSGHRGYLIWKIREAEKGRITVGPVQPRTNTGEPKEMKVLPLSLEATAVEKMDAAWRAKGIKSRAEFLRQAIGAYLTQLGATEEAILFVTE